MVTARAPQVEVFQRIAAAHGITGATIDTMISGSVAVRQEISNAADITGVEIHKLGTVNSPYGPRGPDEGITPP